MTEELPWFFHAVKHGINIEELKEWVVNEQFTIADEYSKYTGRGNINQHFFDAKSSTKNFFHDMVKGICERNDIPFTNMKYSNSWTIDGYENSYHDIHRHTEPDGSIRGGMSVLIYLSLPKDMSDMKGWFFYVDKDGEWCYVKPELDTAFIFSQQVPHGTNKQSEGLRKTLNIEFYKDKE